MLISLVLAAAVTAESVTPKAGPSFDVWLWKIVVVSQSAGHDDLWGARVAARVPMGRLVLAGRVDVSALAGVFDGLDPATYKTVEAYATAAWELRRGGGLSLAGVYGFTAPLQAEPGLVNPNKATLGGGLRWRVGPTGFAYVLAGRHEAAGEGFHLMGTLQAPVGEHFAIVMDGVSGRGRFLRGGVAVKVPLK